MTTGLLLCAGLVLDGGNVLAARRGAISTASQAARAGAQAIDIEALRLTGTLHLDPALATAAAQAFLAAAGTRGTVTIRGDEVQVTVHAHQSLSILGIAGRGDVTVSGRASARPVHGISAAEGP
jgi:Flp pilus assembly protein TadG